jgi:phospholipid-binding lipoprotein MlaA
VTYRDLVPSFVRDMVRNFLENLRTPQVLGNDLLQGDLAGAGDTTLRFVANTTIGLGGLFDIMPARRRWEDFGQTLGVWGLGEGFYVVLPVLGPSSVRDAVGLAVDTFTDPIYWWARNTDREEITWARTGVTGLDTRTQNLETLDEIERTAIDFYATLRSAYRQRRIDEIRDGRTGGPSRMSTAPHRSPIVLYRGAR